MLQRRKEEQLQLERLNIFFFSAKQIYKNMLREEGIQHDIQLLRCTARITNSVIKVISWSLISQLLFVVHTFTPFLLYPVKIHR